MVIFCCFGSVYKFCGLHYMWRLVWVWCQKWKRQLHVKILGVWIFVKERRFMSFKVQQWLVPLLPTETFCKFSIWTITTSHNSTKCYWPITASSLEFVSRLVTRQSKEDGGGLIPSMPWTFASVWIKAKLVERKGEDWELLFLAFILAVYKKYTICGYQLATRK